MSYPLAWMLTPNDESSDGRFRRYLHEPNKWRHYDRPLFDHLRTLLQQHDVPSVTLLERTPILSGARYFSEIVPDERSSRARWSERLAKSVAGSDLVFLDPDNGFEIPSKPIGRKGSSKYVAWHEVQMLWEAGSSVLVYQHYCRKPREAFTSQLAKDLQRRTGSRFIEAFSTPNVVFLLAAQSIHLEVFEEAIAHHLSGWQGQITVAGLRGE